jgi:hypothetical protein
MFLAELVASYIVGRIDVALLLVFGTFTGQALIFGYLFRRLAILMNAGPGTTGWY